MQTIIDMQGGTALVQDMGASLAEPYCEQCGTEVYPGDTAWIVVELDSDDMPYEPTSQSYGYCSRGCARRDGAI